jgi:hypothetical protein
VQLKKGVDNSLYSKARGSFLHANTPWQVWWRPDFTRLALPRNRCGEVCIFYNWVRKFVGFVKPRKWDQALHDNVEDI